MDFCVAITDLMIARKCARAKEVELRSTLRLRSGQASRGRLSPHEYFLQPARLTTYIAESRLTELRACEGTIWQSIGSGRIWFVG